MSLVPPRIDDPVPGDDQQPIIDSDLKYQVGSKAIGVSNRRVILQCRDRIGKPPSSIIWELPSGQRLKPGDSITEPSVRVDDDSLIITTASSDSNGSYSCHAENIAGTDTASSIVTIYCKNS